MAKQHSFHAGMVLAILAILLVGFAPTWSMADDPNDYVLLSTFSNGDCSGEPDTTDKVAAITNKCMKNEGEPIDLIIRGKRIRDVTSAAILCPQNKLSYGTGDNSHHTCSKRRRPLSQVCVPDKDGQHSIKIRCAPPDVCISNSHISRKACNKRINACADRPLKWAGRGCKSPGGHPLHDGGCQCKGYCGYQCEDACSDDSDCVWNANQGKCFRKGSSVPGESIATCPLIRIPHIPVPAPRKSAAAQGESSGLFTLFGDQSAQDDDDDDDDA